jgi:uncharacterized paraquat-inducible protein A
MKEGDIVIEKNGQRAVVHSVYSKLMVSLCLEGYDEVKNMIERDSQTEISELKPTGENIFDEYHSCSSCDSMELLKESDSCGRCERCQEEYPFEN